MNRRPVRALGAGLALAMLGTCRTSSSRSSSTSKPAVVAAEDFWGSIARQLGVSRIPVREAIIALDREGWLTITPHRGAFVHGLDEDSLRDHYVLLGLVYGLAARRATERASADGLAQFADAQRRLAAAKSPEELHDTNDEFLRALLALAHSPRLGSVMRNMSTVVPGNFFELVPGSGKVQQAGSKRIVTAIVARDPVNRWLHIEDESGEFYRSSDVELDSDKGHLASGVDAGKWAPKLQEFLRRLMPRPE